MPNWCSTGITFYSENKKEIKMLKQRIVEIYNGPATRENGFGRGWLGDYANKFYPEIGSEKINCRGCIGHIDDTVRRVDKYFAFSISTETAWSAKIGLWYKILKDFYPDIKLAYIAEECGNVYYVKWDETGKFYPEEYYVDICYPTSDGDIEYIDDHAFYSLAEIYNWLEENLPFDFEKKDDVDELETEIISKLDECENSDEYFCTIAKYDKINPSEFEFQNN